MSSTSVKRACNSCKTEYDHRSVPGTGGAKPTETFTVGLVAVNFASCYVCHKPLTMESTFAVPTAAKGDK